MSRKDTIKVMDDPFVMVTTTYSWMQERSTKTTLRFCTQSNVQYQHFFKDKLIDCTTPLEFSWNNFRIFQAKVMKKTNPCFRLDTAHGYDKILFL